MSGQPPGQLRDDELPEYPIVGPFGGIQSEVSLPQVGRTGFAEMQNLICRNSHMRTLGAFQPLTRPASGVQILNLSGTIAALSGTIAGLANPIMDGPVIGIADFFAVNGSHIFVVWTPTRMYQNAGGVWNQVNGTLTGSQSQFMSWDVVGYKIFFSQQQDPVWQWDGITSSFSTASASAVPGKYLCELDFHLLVANTIEAGNAAPNRIHWTGIGDGTDWTSFSSGQTDLFNAFGPINGLCRVYTNGYAFQQFGITQIVPTGIGTAPFQFIKMGSRAKGSITPWGLASFGDLIACYIGKDDIYIFDGTESQGIGAQPMQGGRRIGARTRIFNDLYTTGLSNVYGFISTSMNSNSYEAYWIFIPGLNKAWIYHFDDAAWNQIYFTPGQLFGPAGVFSTQTVPRIEDLQGTISQQSWTFASLGNVSPLDTMAISDANANTVSLLNFSAPAAFPTSGSINANDGWYIKSAPLTFDDPRHEHTVTKVRVVVEDYTANDVMNCRVTNERAESTLASLTFGTGSGAPNSLMFPIDPNINGRYITIELSGPKNALTGIVEVTPIYDVGGELRGA